MIRRDKRSQNANKWIISTLNCVEVISIVALKCHEISYGCWWNIEISHLKMKDIELKRQSMQLLNLGKLSEDRRHSENTRRLFVGKLKKPQKRLTIANYLR
jgi:hypothetical protein